MRESRSKAGNLVKVGNKDFLAKSAGETDSSAPFLAACSGGASGSSTRWTRREFLRAAGVGALGFLAACAGVDGSVPTTGSSEDASPTPSLEPPATATNTPEATKTATPEPTEVVKKLPERWNDPEVMERVRAKFESHQSLFDQIEAGTLRYQLLDVGREGDVKKVMQSGWSSGFGPQQEDFTGNMVDVVGGAVGRPGILFAHERLRYSPEIQAEVVFAAIYSGKDPEEPFKLVPFVVGVGDDAGRGASIMIGDKHGNVDIKDNFSVFNSLDELGAYLEDKVRSDRPPLCMFDVSLVVNQRTGAKEPGVVVNNVLYRLNYVEPDDEPRDEVMRSFILDYYTDANYPVFPGVVSMSTAGAWTGADKWVAEAEKTRMGLFMEYLSLRT